MDKIPTLILPVSPSLFGLYEYKPTYLFKSTLRVVSGSVETEVVYCSVVCSGADDGIVTSVSACVTGETVVSALSIVC